MELSIPTNWNFDLLDQIEGLPVHDIYGKSTKDVLGGGRPSYALNDASREKIQKYVDRVHDLGAEFNYLLNAPCFGNTEYTKKGQKNILELLDWLDDIGVDSITATSPYLLQVIEEQSSFKTITSTYCCIDTVQRAKQFEKLGVDIITLPQYINRNFKLLNEIEEGTSAGLKLITNLVCIFGCPYLSTHYHANVMGHASGEDSVFGEYSIFNCTEELLSNPEEIIKARWIRPEDLEKYEQLGFEIFKIAGRNRTSEKIAEMAQAYAKKKFDGDLIDLFDVGWNRSTHSPLSFKELPKNISFLKTANKIRKALKNVNIKLDNQSISDDFIKQFLGKDCKSTDCVKCGYCKEISKEAISKDKKSIRKSIKNLREVKERFNKFEAF